MPTLKRLSSVRGKDILVKDNLYVGGYLRTGVQWEDLRFPAQGINPPGAASDPTIDTTSGLLVFSASAVNTVAGVAQLPHAWKVGSALHPHIHWIGSSATDGNVVWKLEYKIVPIGEVVPASYTEDIVAVAAGTVASKHKLTQFTTIAMPYTGVSITILWRVSRVGNNAADTYTGTASLLEFDIHYQSDSIGSDSEMVKS